MKTLIKMLKDQSGASAAEYALILAIVGVGIAVAAGTLGGAISDSMNCASGKIGNDATLTADC
ncbi:MAG: Flp family type IVb pilin [Sphingomicrobium sp.]